LYYNGIKGPEIKEIREFELYCVIQLDYKLNIVTPLMAAEFMISNGIYFSEEPRITINLRNDKNYNDPLIKLVKEIIEYMIEGKFS
jgi:hypothetical protein